jgi:hypothetical protein
VLEPLYVWQENINPITDAADSCLKRPKLKNNKRKGLSHKKWYDCDLKKTKVVA